MFHHVLSRKGGADFGITGQPVLLSPCYPERPLGVWPENGKAPKPLGFRGDVPPDVEIVR